MKIDKIVFSCSEAYSPWWNIQSRVWRTKFGIEPVCLLYGDKAKCGMSEEFGSIVEMAFDPSLPHIIQIQFSKFHHPTTDPESTWLIGDMDQIPLQVRHFTEGVDQVPENGYMHFNYTLCGQMRGLNGEVFKRMGAYVNGGFDLPGHYHAAKGRIYDALYFKGRSFSDVVKEVVESNRYGMVKEDARRNLNPAIHGSFWVAEEMYTSEHLWYGIRKGIVDGFHGKEYHIWDGKIDRVGNLRDSQGRWIPQWNGTDYVYDAARLAAGGYVDLHCHRPYHEQEKAMMRILEIAGMV